MAGALLTLAPSIWGQDVRQHRVLALYVTTPGAAGAVAWESALREVLGDALGSRLDFHSEYIDSLSAIQRDTAALAEEVRHVSHDLHPSLLQYTGLVPALTALCAQFGKQRGIAVTCHAVPDLEPIDADTALCVYRVTQEALHNAGKHAQALRVDVQLTRTATGVQLSIADDGKGFELANTRGRVDGLGLVSIDERVRILRGSVDIQTQPGAGTLIVVRLPSSDVTRRVDDTAFPAEA